MMYLIGLILSTALGFFLLRLLRKGTQITGILFWLFAIALGLGINGIITFYIHLLFEWHAPWAPITASILLLAVLIILSSPNVFIGDLVRVLDARQKRSGMTIVSNWPGLALLGIIAVFTLLEANYYPLGGWDAWSCWNLKAKFIYLGTDRWKEMFDPLLWRSNTHYPLLLPCINVWFWDLSGKANALIPLLNSVLFTLLCAGVLLFGLYRSTKQWAMPLIVTAVIFLIPFNITLGISQYSDIVLGLYLLCAFVCLMQDEFMLCAVFIGLLSFTKTEGTVAAGILAILIALKHKKCLPQFLPPLCLALLPTVLFTVLMAPPNEAFVNGLLSTSKPSTLQRLQVVFVYPLYELLSVKWNGIWFLLLLSVAVYWKDAFRGRLQIFALFFTGYFAVLFAYYQVNTFFEITWWMQSSLNRFLFAVLPSVALWVGLTYSKKPMP